MDVFLDGPLYVSIHSTSVSEIVCIYTILWNCQYSYIGIRHCEVFCTNPIVRFILIRKSEVWFQWDCPNSIPYEMLILFIVFCWQLPTLQNRATKIQRIFRRIFSSWRLNRSQQHFWCDEYRRKKRSKWSSQILSMASYPVRNVSIYFSSIPGIRNPCVACAEHSSARNAPIEHFAILLLCKQLKIILLIDAMSWTKRAR